ncbi:L-2,4-diaminobutyrate decarboxylase [bacterium HR33]|nr:L-2,4-diaminobutyrate decarboxylase [bacterium HR33]
MEWSKLELTGAEFRDLVNAAMERVARWVDTLDRQPASDVKDAEPRARSLVEERLPRQGSPLDELLELLFDRAVPLSLNTAGPGYLAYIPGGGLLHAAVGDLIADAVNRYVGVWIAAPGMVQLESNVVRWFCEIAGYPEGSGGFLTSGGSLANFTAIVAARFARLGDRLEGGTIYASDQTHSSIPKAARLAGFPADSVKLIPSDETFRIRLDLLEQQIAADRRAGKEPFLLVGNAGTTNTGAVDDLQALADLAEREGLWFHVDAAYGGFFNLTERGRAVLRGIERSDSVVLDPHKTLFFPYGTGSLLVRDRTKLEEAHALSADYLPEMRRAPDLVDFCQLSPELSRPPRGLRVWLALKLCGIEAFARALDEKLDLAQWAAAQLREIEGIEIVAEPQLSTLAFRLTRPGMDTPELNRLNRRFLELINERRRVYLTGTMLGDRFVLRICVVSFRTHLDRMEQALEDIRAAVSELAGAGD